MLNAFLTYFSSNEIKIFNLLGEILFEKKFTDNNFNNKLTINISNFNIGIYYLTYSSNGKISSVKFTVY